MHFDHDTAARLMTPEFLVFHKDVTDGETIRSFRELARRRT